ncbi:M23 family metallopeptidase [Candidatus Dependentiae bacterium]|nr:M23 family metallopeptidase [Candidatus Dependentiae bacterium]
MNSFGKVASLIGVILIVSAGGWKFNNYMYTTSTPTCQLSGIEPGGTYGQAIVGKVRGQDDYKVARLILSIDGEPLSTFKIGKSSFEHPFSLSLENLSQGKHIFTAEVETGGHITRKVCQKVEFYVDKNPVQLAFVKNGVDAKVYQGKTFHLQFQANKELKSAVVKLFSKEYPCFLESNRSLVYECYIPIECEEVPHEYALTVEAMDRVGNKASLETTVRVLSFPFRKQSLTIPADKIKAEDEKGLSEKDLETDIEALLKKSPRQKLWHGPFITPIEIKDQKQITTDYGVIRTTQQRGVCQHKALDMYTTPKSVIWAPQDGIIALKNRFAHSGNTVIIDHGWGVFTLLFHLDTFAPLEVGEMIKKGKPVGTLGKTGYATGYHVHWEMRIGNVAVDPLEWTKSHF